MSESKKHKIASFNPNDVGLSSNQIFGLPFSEAEAEVILVPVPWDVTVSYGGGCSNGPAAIREASYQIDLHDPDLPLAWQHGIAMQEVPETWASVSSSLRQKAVEIIKRLSDGESPQSVPALRSALAEVNDAGHRVRTWVRDTTAALLAQGKLVGLVGGDHSTPLGFLDALASKHSSFGILQIDAHCDLREAYEGFTYSHASIMWNALTLPQVERIVQVGIRDYSQGEVEFIETAKGRVVPFFDSDLKRRGFEGATWKDLCRDIVQALPKNVYISFDIDGLDPKLCPHTGTPVPGGFEFEQAMYLLLEVVRSGRNIVGFDLCEVTPDDTEWDANVGARVLYKLCNLMVKSRIK